MNRFVCCAFIALFLSPLHAAVNLSLFFGPSYLQEGQDYSGAWVFLGEVATNDMRIDLVSSQPDRVWVQSSVIVPSGRAGAQFRLQCFDNTLIEPDYDVQITARYYRFAATNMNVRVHSNDSATLAITMDPVREGTQSIGTVTLGGSVPWPVTIKLSASNNRLIIPPAVVVNPGDVSAEFPIKVEDDSIWQQDELVRVTAAADGFSEGFVDEVIVNDDIGKLGVFRDVDVATLGGSIKITTRTLDPNDGYMYENRLRPVDLTLILADGSTAPGPTVHAILTNGFWRGDFQFPQTLSGPVKIRATDEEGHSGDSQPLDVMRILSLTVSDLVWDSRRAQIYAAVSSDAAAHSNSIVAIDPATGEVIRSVPMEGDPKHLAITSAEEFLYVALDASGSIAQIDLDTFTVKQQFALGSTAEKLYAADIETVKGRPELLVVSRYKQAIPSFAGVAVYKNGTELPVEISGGRGANLIEPSSDPNIFFGLGTEGDLKFRWLQLASDGIREIDASTNLIKTYETGVLKAEGDFVVWSGGTAFDGAGKRVLGTFPTQGTPCPDVEVNRVFFLETSRPYLRDFRLAAYEPSRFTKVGETRLPIVFSQTSNLIRWGTNGLAFIADTNLVIAYSSLLVPTAPVADLSVSIEGSAASAKVDETFKIIARATNNTPNPARNVTLTISTPAQSYVTNYTATIGEVIWSYGGFAVVIPELAAHGEAQLELSVVPTKAAPISATAGVSSTTIDPNPTNDFAALWTSVTFTNDADSINDVAIGANSIVSDPLRGLIWVSTADFQLGYAIVSLNPTNGIVSEPITFQGKPGQLAISRNGRYLYAILQDAPAVQRIALDLRLPDLRIPMGVITNNIPYYAQDIEVLDGDGTSFIISRRAGPNGKYQGLAVFDGAVQRPETAPSTLVANSIEATAATNVFIGWDWETSEHWLRRFTVDANGVHADEAVAATAAGLLGDIHANHSDIVVADGGSVLDARTLALKGRTQPDYANGYPIVDIANDRIFRISGSDLYSFDPDTLEESDRLNLRGSSFGPKAAVRWGDDGFAMITDSGFIQIVRWSRALPNTSGPKLRGVVANATGELEFRMTYRPGAAGAIRVWTSEDLQTWTEQIAGWREEALNDGWDGGVYRESRIIIENNGASSRFVKITRTGN